MNYIDKKHAEDWLLHAEKKVDDRPTTDERHIVVIYGSDSVETAIKLEAETRLRGWTILYREGAA